ncbi:MAG: hypothetical protein KME12_26005 [Trichocoleus desertorum ATA4-8-CV12]|jgi:hypothetical protein|nr:hypothetical protein [Trichocoleus desertorum ATA4-8-CV12]
MTISLINALDKNQEALSKQLLQTNFLSKLQTGDFSEDTAKHLVALQLGYNVKFLSALTEMRGNFLGDPDFISSFLDPHMSTELGSDLDSVGLKQHGKTHIAMLYSLATSLSMNKEELYNWGHSAQEFFERALLGLIGSPNRGRALGSLYADEVFANVWFPVYYEGFKNFCLRTDRMLDLEFFRSHADEIEPAHVEHASYLIQFCVTTNTSLDDFQEGYKTFHAHLVKKFNRLFSENFETVSLA